MAHQTLMRSSQNSKIAGVCGGFGEYFDMDPNVWRIVFILLLFMGSIGFWLYLACIFILPVNKNY